MKQIHFWNRDNYNTRAAAELDGATYTTTVSANITPDDLKNIVETISMCIYYERDVVAYEVTEWNSAIPSV